MVVEMEILYIYVAKKLPSNKFFGYEISTTNKIIKKKTL